jgi:hypothetical protein
MFKMFKQPYLSAETDIATGSEVQVEAKAEESIPATTEAKLKIKYNHEEKEITLDEARELAQKGLNYEKGMTKAEQKAKDALIAEMYAESHGITTYEQYQEALKEQAAIQRYEDKGIPEDTARELMAQEKSQKAKDKDISDFLETFRKENGKDFDTVNDKIPKEVEEEIAKGSSITKAYKDYVKEQKIAEKEAEIQKYKAELEELKKGTKAKEVNKENAETATGSVTGNGTGEEVEITYDSYQKNKHDPKWLSKNYTKIVESRKQW